MPGHLENTWPIGIDVGKKRFARLSLIQVDLHRNPNFVGADSIACENSRDSSASFFAGPNTPLVKSISFVSVYSRYIAHFSRIYTLIYLLPLLGVFQLVVRGANLSND